jgi:hypothetical protein
MHRPHRTTSRASCRLVAVALLSAACSPPAAAQSVFLRLHPRVGDTLHTRLDQQTEVSGTMRGSGGTSLKPVTTSVALISRTIVQSSLAASTIVLTIVDSADVRTTDEHAASQVAAAERSLRGSRMLLRLAADGTVESAQDAQGVALTPDMSDAMAAMPAIFPHRPVSPGDQWTREMPLPMGGPAGTRGAGRVNATFHFDSLDHAGTIAFLSVRGDVLPSAEREDAALSGTISGVMQVDRTRGWMTDSRFLILIRSAVTPPASSGLAPMRFVTRVTQRLRTMDKR